MFMFVGRVVYISIMQATKDSEIGAPNVLIALERIYRCWEVYSATLDAEAQDEQGGVGTARSCLMPRHPADSWCSFEDLA